MTEHATVTAVTHCTATDGSDVVALEWNGRAYFWPTEHDRYQVGQVVAVDPPSSPDRPITPALTPPR